MTADENRVTGEQIEGGQERAWNGYRVVEGRGGREGCGGEGEDAAGYSRCRRRRG